MAKYLDCPRTGEKCGEWKCFCSQACQNPGPKLKCEFLRAFEDGMWDTKVVEVPFPPNATVDQLIEWAQTATDEGFAHRKVVAFAVFSFPFVVDEGIE